jgi:hypothetical protein
MAPVRPAGAYELPRADVIQFTIWFIDNQPE